MIFENFDFTDFWANTEYAKEEYIGKKPTDEQILETEAELGYKLPAAYIEMIKLQNGGIPKYTRYPTTANNSWAIDHIAITGIMGIDKAMSNSLCGDGGSKFWTDDWGYPDCGIYICDCPSAGHDMVMLDYSDCGQDGEPTVVHVDQEFDYKKTLIARDFETFIRGLQKEVY